MDEKNGVNAVDRALDILAVFDNHPDPMTISDIARRAGLYKSTALRLISSLRAYGYIQQFEDGRYHLGATLLRLGTMYQRANRMEERVVPVLEQLVRAGSESPSFYIRQGDTNRLCIFRVDSGHATLDRVKTGLLLPLDKGAAGRVFLAFDADRTEPSFAQIRRSGYALSYGETDPDCAAVAAPIFDFSDKVIGSLSISGPLSRFDETTVARQIALLLPAAATLSRAFGGRFEACLTPDPQVAALG